MPETLAVVLSQLGHNQEALVQLREAVASAPNDAEVHFKLALAWNENDEMSKALSELKTAVKLDPHNSQIAYNLGLALSANGNPAEAIQTLLDAEKSIRETHESLTRARLFMANLANGRKCVAQPAEHLKSIPVSMRLQRYWKKLKGDEDWQVLKQSIFRHRVRLV